MLLQITLFNRLKSKSVDHFSIHTLNALKKISIFVAKSGLYVIFANYLFVGTKFCFVLFICSFVCFLISQITKILLDSFIFHYGYL